MGEHPWKHMFLIPRVCLLLSSLLIVIAKHEFRSGRYGSPIGAVALIFNHVGFQDTNTGWPSNVMKTIVFAWLVFMLVFRFGILRT